MIPRRPFAVALVAILAACASQGTSSSPSAAAPAAAASPTTSAPVQEAPYFEFQVEKPVTPGNGSCNPKYPVELREAGTTGTVVAQFIVDATGMVEPATFKILSSTHDAFTTAVREAIPCMRFAAASIKGRRVRQVVQQPFTFDVARSR